MESAVKSGVSKEMGEKAVDLSVKQYVQCALSSHCYVSYRGQEPGVWRQLQWPAMCLSFCLYGKDLLFVHLRWTDRRTALVLNKFRL